jgi:K+-sensing histidine kinase KdpD
VRPQASARPTRCCASWPPSPPNRIEDDDPARAIARFAQQHQITQIVIGSSQRSRWQQLTGGGSHVIKVIRAAGAVGIDVIARRDVPAVNE